MTVRFQICFVLAIVCVMCESAAYPQDPGINNYRRQLRPVGGPYINSDAFDQDTSRHLAVNPAPVLRSHQRRHSNGQSEHALPNATRPNAVTNPAPRRRGNTASSTTKPASASVQRRRGNSPADEKATPPRGNGHARLTSGTLHVVTDNVRRSSSEDVNERNTIPLNATSRLDGFASSRLGVERDTSPVNESVLEEVFPSSYQHDPVRSDGIRRVGGSSPDGHAANSARRTTDKPLQDKQHRAGSRIKLPNEGNIVFPGQEKVGVSNRSRYVPRISGDDGPPCANGKTFCEAVADGYPKEHLRTVLKTEAIVFRELFGSDEVTNTSITQRIDVSEESSMCVSVEEVVFPKMAQNKEEKWLWIVNQDQHTQGVRIETCRSADSECIFADAFPLGYRSFCKQKYIYRKMLAVNENGLPNPDSFKLPSCCSCHFVRLEGAQSRMAIDPTTQSPAPKKLTRRRRFG